MERIDSQGANAQEETAAATSASGNQTESQSEKENTAEKQRNPSVSNPRWEDASGRTIAKALVGDEVYLCADVTDIADGATAKINIVEKDGDDDFVAELSTSVQEGKIRRKWKVVYMADDDDTDSQKELEEKGYTLPEYAFTVECDGTKSEESGQLDVTGGLKVQLKENKTNAILKNIKISLKQNDSIYKTLTTDENGCFELMEIPIGEYEIILEN